MNIHCQEYLHSQITFKHLQKNDQTIFEQMQNAPIFSSVSFSGCGHLTVDFEMAAAQNGVLHNSRECCKMICCFTIAPDKSLK